MTVAAFKSLQNPEFRSLSRGWPLSSSARRAVPPVITHSKLLKLMLRLNTVLTSACLGSETATINMLCNRLSRILAPGVTCSSEGKFPAPVTNQAVSDLKPWDPSGIDRHPSCPPSEHHFLSLSRCWWGAIRPAAEWTGERVTGGS